LPPRRAGLRRRRPLSRGADAAVERYARPVTEPERSLDGKTAHCRNGSTPGLARFPKADVGSQVRGTKYRYPALHATARLIPRPQFGNGSEVTLHCSFAQSGHGLTFILVWFETEELARRAGAHKVEPPTGEQGYHKFLLERVTQADLGPEFDFPHAPRSIEKIPRPR
jgi:hypothetical protein